jgi:cytochrome c peroxidase
VRMSRWRSTFSFALLLFWAPGVSAQRLSESTGVNLFKNNCTSCHGIVPAEHAPTEATIKQMARSEYLRPSPPVP